MYINKKEIIKLMLLFIIIAVIAIILLKETLSFHKKVSELDVSLQNILLSAELHEDTVKMMSSVRDYINHFDQEYINDYRRYNAIIVKNQLELYSSVNIFEKQEVEDLIELYKAYSSFVEKEVIPIIGSGNKNDKNISYLNLRHKDFIFDITKKMDTVGVSGKREISAYFQNTLINNSLKVTAMLLSLIMILVMFILVIYRIIKSFFMRNIYLEKLVENMKNPIMVVDKKGVLTDINKPARDMFGISADVLLNRNISEIPALFPHLQSITQPLNAVILQGQALSNHNITYLHSGLRLKLVVDYYPVFVYNRIFGAVMAAERAGKQKDKNVLLDTLEAERKRTSIEIHDWIGRHMSAMIHSLDYILRLEMEKTSDQLQNNLHALRAHCQNAAIEMRGIMNDIHPYLIDRVGLISALESYISNFERINNIKVYVMYQDRSLKVKKENEIIIYRIIQEALTNVTKHSKSTEVDINFTVSSESMKIEVADNGGYLEDFIAGNGLWGMKERAGLIGGEIDFRSKGHGFSVTLNVPVISGGLQDA
ncbi:MAG: hypothetical protein VR68_15720 [Peptococcaceae bacterium BRH_c4a]|nr:MAG: hypothetical protein VR68_15720 [Peptococcaceae bacterium BRH_c4a]